MTNTQLGVCIFKAVEISNFRCWGRRGGERGRCSVWQDEGAFDTSLTSALPPPANPVGGSCGFQPLTWEDWKHLFQQMLWGRTCFSDPTHSLWSLCWSKRTESATCYLMEKDPLTEAVQNLQKLFVLFLSCKMETFESKSLCRTAGVQQGSVLVPVLFSKYFIDFPPADDAVILTFSDKAERVSLI